MPHPPPRPSRTACSDQGPRAPDLAPAEASTAGWFAALPRTGAPAWSAPDVGLARPTAGSRRFSLPLGAVAAVLVALLLPTPGPDVGAQSALPVASPERQFAVSVVDDPSVPMLHAVETFDQLAMLTQPDGMGGR